MEHLGGEGVHRANVTEVVRIEDVASKLKISERTVEKLIAEGVFPVYRIGRLVFLDFEEVIEAIRIHGRSNDQSVDG